MIDILVVGAGPSGLCAAKTLLQVTPGANLLIVEARPSLGGIWSKEQLYPTLRTNNLLGSLDFTDFPMDPDRFGVQPGEHMTGESMNAYYIAYAENFGLTDRIRYNTRVLEVRSREQPAQGRDTEGFWVVEVMNTTNATQERVECRKLVVATGVLNVPRMPDLPGLADFDAPFIHSVDLGPQADAVFGKPIPTTSAFTSTSTSANASIDEWPKAEDFTMSILPEDKKRVCVIGGSKSAYDAVYLACSRGHQVEWVISRTGRGPHWVFPTHTYLGPFRAWRERLVTRRFFAFMSPWAFPDFSGVEWMRKFLHKTGPGRLISRTFWGVMHHDTLRDCGYKTHPALNALEPEQGPFWWGTASGTLNYEHDIHEFLRTGQAVVHRDDLSHLSPHTVHLKSGATLEGIDALVASTGYVGRPTVTFSPASTHSSLGVPSNSLDSAQESFWASLNEGADSAIGTSFPRLLAGPPGDHNRLPHADAARHEKPYTPWRLYRGIAPPGPAAQGDRSLVFIGMMSNLANSIRLEIQCLWAAAYLSDRLRGDPNLLAGMESRSPKPQPLTLPTTAVGHPEAAKRIFEDAALLQRFALHRAPLGHGRLYPDLVFDQMPYWDVLLHDLGLATRRKGNVFKEVFEAYTQDDYRGFVEEWMERNK